MGQTKCHCNELETPHLCLLCNKLTILHVFDNCTHAMCQHDVVGVLLFLYLNTMTVFDMVPRGHIIIPKPVIESDRIITFCKQ